MSENKASRVTGGFLYLEIAVAGLYNIEKERGEPYAGMEAFQDHYHP